MVSIAKDFGRGMFPVYDLLASKSVMWGKEEGGKKPVHGGTYLQFLKQVLVEGNKPCLPPWTDLRKDFRGNTGFPRLFLLCSPLHYTLEIG